MKVIDDCWRITTVINKKIKVQIDENEINIFILQIDFLILVY